MLLYANGNSVTYFNGYGVKYIPEEIKRFCRQQKHHNKYLQNTSIGFIDSMFKGKTLTNFTISFSPHHFKKTDEVILNYFLKQDINIGGSHLYNTKKIFDQLDYPLQLRLSRIKQIEDIFSAEISETEKISTG